MAPSLAAVFFLALGVSCGYAQQYGTSIYSPLASSYSAAPTNYKSSSYGASSSYNSYVNPAPSYSAGSASYNNYQIPVQTYSASSSYKAPNYAATPVAASGYAALVPSYVAPASTSYQVPVSSYGMSNKSSSYTGSSNYGASASYGAGGYSSATRNVRLTVMANEFTENTPGTSQSFLSELLAAIQSVSNLRFIVTIRHDLGYPKQQSNGRWDGSIFAPLLNNEADLVGTDLTPNTEGEKVAEFTQPILPYKLQVLINVNAGYGSSYQNNLQYVIADTEDLSYLKNSPQQTLQTIYNNIQQGQANGLGTIVFNNVQGVAKVLSGNNYAYIIESPFVQRALAQSSILQLLPGDLGGYFKLAFATQLGSTLRKEVDIALLQVLQDGTLKTLLQKYNFYTTAL